MGRASLSPGKRCTKMSLKDRLEAIRKELGNLSQKGASEVFGLGENTWAVYERREKLPQDNVLEMLSGRGFSIDWLISGEGCMKKDQSRIIEQITPRSDISILNQDILESVIEGLEISISRSGRLLKPKQKAKVVSTLYGILHRRHLVRLAGGQPTPVAVEVAEELEPDVVALINLMTED